MSNKTDTEKEKLYLELTQKIEYLLHEVLLPYDLSDKDKQEVMETVFKEMDVDR